MLEYGASSVFELRYHMVLVTKYRAPIFSDEIFEDLKINLNTIAANHSVNIEMVEQDISRRDHIHIVFTARPVTTIASFVQGFKRSSAHMILKNYPEVKTSLWKNTIWSPSYFVTSVSEVSRKTIEDYVATQGAPNRSRNKHGRFDGSNKQY